MNMINPRFPDWPEADLMISRHVSTQFMPYVVYDHETSNGTVIINFLPDPEFTWSPKEYRGKLKQLIELFTWWLNDRLNLTQFMQEIIANRSFADEGTFTYVADQISLRIAKYNSTSRGPSVKQTLDAIFGIGLALHLSLRLKEMILKIDKETQP